MVSYGKTDPSPSRGVGPISIEYVNLTGAQAVPDAQTFAADVRTGLTSPAKYLSCRYFYDETGSQLFEAICDLPEYYLTRAEHSILVQQAPQLADRLANPLDLVELGSGSSTKTRLIIEACLQGHDRLRYLPIDISHTMLSATADALQRDYPALDILALAGDYDQGLEFLRDTAGPNKLILWLGSSVGNFNRAEAALFLRSVRESMSMEDRLLLGVDLRKDRAVLEAAYDDAQQVTARFNLNILARINRELDGDFDLGSFCHRAVYHREEGRVAMYLTSQGDQRVRLGALDMEVDFTAGEVVHTEDSFKYSKGEIDALAQAADLRVESQWLDDGQRFSTNLMAPL